MRFLFSSIGKKFQDGWNLIAKNKKIGRIFMDNQYSREYQVYLTYALQCYLIEHCNYAEKDAEIKVMQDFEEVEQEAREAGFL